MGFFVCLFLLFEFHWPLSAERLRYVSEGRLLPDGDPTMSVVRSFGFCSLTAEFAVSSEFYYFLTVRNCTRHVANLII